MKPTVLHVQHHGKRWWLVADQFAVLRGGAGESRASLLRAWERAHGCPATGYARVPGVVNLVQAGLNVGLFWREAEAPPAKGGARR